MNTEISIEEKIRFISLMAQDLNGYLESDRMNFALTAAEEILDSVKSIIEIKKDKTINILTNK